MRWLVCFVMVCLLLASSVSALTNRTPNSVVYSTGNGGYPPEYAIDGNLETRWVDPYAIDFTSGDSTVWEAGARYDMGAIYNITKLWVYARPYSYRQACGAGDIRVCNSSSCSGYPVVLQQTNFPHVGAEWAWWEVDIPDRFGRYVEAGFAVTANENNGPCWVSSTTSGNYLNLYEVRVQTEATTTTTTTTLPQPVYDEFEGLGETTNLSGIENDTEVENLVLDDATFAKIAWNSNVTLNSTMNITEAIEFTDLRVFVNSTKYNRFNVSANVTFYGVESNGIPAIYYTSDGFSGNIFQTGEDCVVSGKCSNVVYDGQNLSFVVTGFGAYGATGTSNLTIFDDTDDGVLGENATHNTGEYVGFYANYTNSSGWPLNGSNANCTYYENSTGSWISGDLMTYNETDGIYYHHEDFTKNETIYFNITCTAVGDGFDRLSLVDTAWVSGTQYVPAYFPSASHWSQVSWFTAESIAHTLSYGIYNSSLSCSQTAMYYVEPVPIDGVVSKLNASTDSSGTYLCQNSSQGVLSITNDGSVGVNISAALSQVTSGVSPKIGYSDGAWESSCSGVCNSTCDLSSSCVLINTSSITIVYNLDQNSSQEVWMWADFNGVEGTEAPTKGNLTTNAVKYT